jgi:hypothetical protein
VLTIVDSLSKRVRLIPTHDDVTAEGAAKLFFDFIVSQLGLPRCIVSDRDTKFTSVFWQNLMKQVGTTLKMPTVDHPQTDRQTERMHRTINARLRTLINHAQTAWEEKLPIIEFQMNCATNQSTGFATFVLDMGRMPRFPLSSVTSDSQLKPNVGEKIS